VYDWWRSRGDVGDGGQRQVSPLCQTWISVFDSGGAPRLRLRVGLYIRRRCW
jgi:hypothetical protein